MIRARIAVGLAGCVALAVMGVSTFALAEDTPALAKGTPIKELMGQNFAGLQTILISLIRSDYAAVPAHANAIHEHALELSHMAPEGTSANRKQFLSYAYNLDAHARDIASISKLLIQHDKDRENDSLGTDHLRGALAAHYGGMVTMCVACHNRFRQQVVQ
jgi:cytochrome c556